MSHRLHPHQRRDRRRYRPAGRAPEPHVDAEPHADIDVDTDVDADAQSHTDAGARPDIATNTQSHADGYSHANTGANVDTGANTQRDADAQPHTGTDARADPGAVFAATFTVEADPSGHSAFIGPQPNEITVTVEGGAVMVSGGASFVPVSGSLSDDGTFTATGAGTVAGFPNVGVRFEGRLTADGLSGSYSMGTGSELPGGQAITYAVE